MRKEKVILRKSSKMLANAPENKENVFMPAYEVRQEVNEVDTREIPKEVIESYKEEKRGVKN